MESSLDGKMSLTSCDSEIVLFTQQLTYGIWVSTVWMSIANVNPFSSAIENSGSIFSILFYSISPPRDLKKKT